MARFGGLRTPSETLSLRWSDVDWERGRLLVHSPKTEHHEGKATRWIPLFPELRGHLETAFDRAAEGAEFVITRYRDAEQNLRTHMLQIIKRAGLTAWPKLFQNLRSPRETELVETYPLHVVTAWLGNSQLVAAKHYLQVTDEHFERAAQKAAQQPAALPRNVTHLGNEGLRFAKTCDTLRGGAICALAEAGLETSHNSPGKSQVAGQGDSQSDSLGGVFDPRLARLIEIWPALTEDVKGGMLTLAGLRPDDVDDFNDIGAEVGPFGSGALG